MGRNIMNASRILTFSPRPQDFQGLELVLFAPGRDISIVPPLVRVLSTVQIPPPRAVPCPLLFLVFCLRLVLRFINGGNSLFATQWGV